MHDAAVAIDLMNNTRNLILYSCRAAVYIASQIFADI